jgi:hypothetical protein
MNEKKQKKTVKWNEQKLEDVKLFEKENPIDSIEVNNISNGKRKKKIEELKEIAKICNIYISEYMKEEDFIVELLKLNWKTEHCSLKNHKEEENYLCGYLHNNEEKKQWDHYRNNFKSLKEESEKIFPDKINEILDTFHELPEHLKKHFLKNYV